MHDEILKRLVLCGIGRSSAVPQLDDQETDEYVRELRARGIETESVGWPGLTSCDVARRSMRKSTGSWLKNNAPLDSICPFQNCGRSPAHPGDAESVSGSHKGNRFHLFGCARARVAPFINSFQLPQIQVGVDGRCRDIRMAKQLLDHSKVAIILSRWVAKLCRNRCG